jgi:hypothetical protein
MTAPQIVVPSLLYPAEPPAAPVAAVRQADPPGLDRARARPRRPARALRRGVLAD